MKNNIFKISWKSSLGSFLILTCFFLGVRTPAVFAQDVQQQESEIKKAKIFRDIYPLISDSDLYCSFFVLDEKMPEIQIVGAEREYEKNLLTDGNIVYTDKGSADGLEPGQLFMILEVGQKIEDFGFLTYKRGRARIVAIEEHGASVRIEKSCGHVSIGQYLVPFEEGESRMGKDLGYDVSPYESQGVSGEVIYLQMEYNQVGSGNWALVNLGEQDGIQKGDQLILYRRVQEGAPLHIFGNSVVIDAQNKTSTVKILSCKDPLQKGDLVQARPR